MLENKTIESYYSICLNDKITQLFTDTMLGVDYWMQHKNQKCYKCRQKGHLAKNCEDICYKCGNFHPRLPFCIFETNKIFEEILKILQGKCKGLIWKYDQLCKMENKLKNEIDKQRAKEIKRLEDEENINIKNIVEKKNIKECIPQHTNEISFKDSPSLEIAFKEYKIKDWKRVKVETEPDYFTSFLNYMMGCDNNKSNYKNKYDKNEIKIFKNSEVYILGITTMKNFGKIEDIGECIKTMGKVEINGPRCILWRNKYREKYLKKLVQNNEKIKELEKEKNAIQTTKIFNIDKVYIKLTKIKELYREIYNLRIKKNQVKDRINDLYYKMDNAKDKYRDIKEKLQHIWEYKEGIIERAREKGEEIKNKAFRKYKYYFGKKDGKTNEDIENEINQVEEYEKENLYNGDYYDLYEDDKIGIYDDDPHILDYRDNPNYEDYQ